MNAISLLCFGVLFGLSDNPRDFNFSFIWSNLRKTNKSLPCSSWHLHRRVRDCQCWLGLFTRDVSRYFKLHNFTYLRKDGDLLDSSWDVIAISCRVNMQRLSKEMSTNLSNRNSSLQQFLPSSANENLVWSLKMQSTSWKHFPFHGCQLDT